MVVSNSERVSVFNPTSATTDFIITWPIFEVSEVKVELDDVETTAFSVIATFVNGRADNATVRLDAAVSTGSVTIFGERAPRSDEDFAGSSSGIKEFVDRVNDRVAAMLQEAARETALSIKMPRSSTLRNVVFPEPEANKVAVGKADGSGWELVDNPSGSSSAALAAATAAQSSASSALAVANQAQTGADNANAEATIARNLALQAGIDITDLDGRVSSLEMASPGGGSGTDQTARDAAAAAQATADQNAIDIANLGATNGGVDQTARDAAAAAQTTANAANTTANDNDLRITTVTTAQAAQDVRITALEATSGTGVDQLARNSAAAAEASAAAAVTDAANALSTASTANLTVAGVQNDFNQLSLEALRSYPNRATYNALVSQGNGPEAGEIVIIRTDSNFGGNASIGTGAQYASDVGVSELSLVGNGGVRGFNTRTEYDTAAAGSNPPDAGDIVFIRTDANFAGAPSIGTGAQYIAGSGVTSLGGGSGGAIDDASTGTTTTWSSGKITQEIAAAVSTGLPSNHFRTFESFGGVATTFRNATRVSQAANDTAIAAAAVWCRDTGGKVVFGSGRYDFNNPFQMLSYTNLEGQGQMQTHLYWPPGQNAMFSSAATGEGIFGVRLQGFTITNDLWNPNKTLAVANSRYAIHFNGQTGGPDDPAALAREGVNSSSGIPDHFHVIKDVRIWEFDGTGIRVDGRGEVFIWDNIISRCAGRGIHTTAPDLWVSRNTVNQTGYDSWYCNSGNVTSDSNKFWYAGMSGAEEILHACIHLDGAGRGNFTSTNDRLQDVVGVGVILNGDHPQFYGLNITGAGGGRPANDGNGWTGTRTLPRALFYIESCNLARIHASCGSVSGAPLAYMVHVAGSGARSNEIHLTYDTVDNDFATPYVVVPNGFTNAKRHMLVTVNGDIAYGRQAQGDLGSASAGFNEVGYRPAQLPLTNGKTANWTGSQWAYPAATPTTITPS